MRWVILVLVLMGLFWSTQEGFRVTMDLDGSVLNRAAGLKENLTAGVHAKARGLRDGMLSMVPFRAHYYKLRRRFK
jgi:hypothetical protein